MTPDQYCKDKAAQSGSSFYYSFMFLPPDKRRAITALYAFCREVDDVVDESSDENVARTTLAWWHTEVTTIYTGTPQHPVTRALIPVVKQYNLPQEHFHEIIDGMEMDLQQHQYADFKALQQYCYRVASVVGLLAAEIFGYTDRNTLKYAHDLGLAFQLTNIIRDVGEDARRGRIYLPLGELALFGVHVNDILDNKESEGFQKLMQFQIDRAQRYYQRAFEQLPAVDRKAQRTGLIMAAIYRATLEEIVASGCHVLKERVSLTPLRKLWLAWKTWVKN
ncbi:MAG: farnesyl-diphosphate farnesyltransferase [Candidatus Nitrotoga sp. SPKER]|nr:MAG: farnesyl-diphosphate farnesyltransferase [Candidatus Nitrotoga sp. SPKER]